MPERVAVVIPARPAEPYLAEALVSVLAQPETAELVIACHGDGPTVELVAGHADPRARLVRSAGPTAGENLDAGLAATRAPWLAFLDADDAWPPGRLAAGLAAFAADPALELCLGQQRGMGADGALADAVVAAPVLGTALVRRVALERVGPFGAGMVAQMRWLVRARVLRTTVLEAVVLHRRAHAANLTRVARPELHGAYLELARERIAQERRA